MACGATGKPWSHEVFDMTRAKVTDPARRRTGGHPPPVPRSGLYRCGACDGPIATVTVGVQVLRPGHPGARAHRPLRARGDHRAAEPARFREAVGAGGRPDTSGRGIPRSCGRGWRRWTRTSSTTTSTSGCASGRRHGCRPSCAKSTRSSPPGPGGATLSKVAAAPDPAQAFREASLMAQRAVIDVLCVVRLKRAARGRMRTPTRQATGVRHRQRRGSSGGGSFGSIDPLVERPGRCNLDACLEYFSLG